jgi:hypothetical protein
MLGATVFWISGFTALPPIYDALHSRAARNGAYVSFNSLTLSFLGFFGCYYSSGLQTLLLPAVYEIEHTHI